MAFRPVVHLVKPDRSAAHQHAAAGRRPDPDLNADSLDNTISIEVHDPKFAKVYRREKAELLAVM
jgi:hypothetical protein